ncbi:MULTISPECIES: thiolase family protein [unclassified Mycobacterium]|uniref:thiolase family protein n=1 Tax=unclassified Mycobacterium TaxID=2642494 RepID=UPI0029C6D22E|nr:MULTISPECIES: thiolase family protein [unclassified Mycobacterium]
MTETVHVVGVGMTRFANHGPGVGIKLGAEASVAALNDAGITFAEVDMLIAGSANPHSPRGVFLARELGLTGKPVQHLSNASATGLAAMHEAIATLEAGRAEVVLVCGLDSPETAVSSQDVIAGEGHHPPAVSFALWARERMATYGTTEKHLAMVAAKNWNYARTNPFAARQAAEPVTVDRVLGSRMVAEPFTSMMCTPWGDGAAAAVLCTESALRRFDASRAVRIAASAFQSDRFGPRQVLEGAIVGPPELTRSTVAEALKQAQLGVADIDIVQLHDAFAIEEILYYELLGFCAPGEAEGLLEQGAFGPNSRKEFGLPEVSTDGGLIGRGHPGGPTGLAQIWETVRRLRQPGGDRVGLCHLLGGGSICIAQILTRDAA